MNSQNFPNHVEMYDTTLRDGTQGEGVSLSLLDKLKIARRLDEIGADFIEGGFPLANPKDMDFFREAQEIRFQHARLCAFGMTRRRGVTAAEDEGMRALVESGAPIITIVGKSWDLHVDEVLKISRQENLDMIRQSLEFCLKGPGASTEAVFYDAEHFFDGYRANPEYALQTLRAAVQGGASRLVLCDTNGGSLPAFVAQAVDAIGREFGDAVKLGIHVHNDGGLAVANSMTAVEHGCVQVQGTINGVGERCGNVDLTTVAANLHFKLGRHVLLGAPSVAQLTELSRYVYELANLNPVANQPYVGASAFAHKGGMHVHAVQRVAHSYEHVNPETVGNRRKVLVSELSGASNIAATLGAKYGIQENKEVQRRVLMRVQDLENEGYQFEAAGASFELLLRTELGLRRRYWTTDQFRCIIFKQGQAAPVTEATVKLSVGGRARHEVAEGDGPINALDGALRLCLRERYPSLDRIHLRDYKVRVVNARAETAAKVRVIIDFAAKMDDGSEDYFSTIGVSENIVEASWQALVDAFEYHLLETGVAAD